MKLRKLIIVSLSKMASSLFDEDPFAKDPSGDTHYPDAMPPGLIYTKLIFIAFIFLECVVFGLVP
jgi:hypothetical protein